MTEDRLNELASAAFNRLHGVVGGDVKCEIIAEFLRTAIAEATAAKDAEIAGWKRDYDQMESAWQDRKDDHVAALAEVTRLRAEVERLRADVREWQDATECGFPVEVIRAAASLVAERDAALTEVERLKDAARQWEKNFIHAKLAGDTADALAEQRGEVLRSVE